MKPRNARLVSHGLIAASAVLAIGSAVGIAHADPAYGFKGPVMAPAPTGTAAVRLWDAIQVLAQEPGFFEFTRPRANPPRVKHA